MLRPLLVCLACGVGTTSIADTLDLDLQLDSIGFSNVMIYDDTDTLLNEFSFLDIEDDIWGITRPFAAFDVGEEVAVTAEISDPDGQLSPCSIGSISCEEAFGDFEDDSFSIGDGEDATVLGDFFLGGGTKIGDAVSLEIFSGAPTFETLSDGGYVFWDTLVHNFTVSSNNLDPSGPPSVAVAPLPAPIALFASGLGLLGLMRLKSRQRHV